MLAAHNNARSNVSPKPCTPLVDLTWSSTLASVAQTYTNRCIFDHNGNRKTDAGSAFARRTVGENLYISVASTVGGPWGLDTDADDVVASWDNEKYDYNFTTNTCKPAKVCGHYTQLVWSSTTQVGCGAKMCMTADTTGHSFNPTRFPLAYLVTCNYADAQGRQQPYKLTTTCPPTTTSSPTTTPAPVTTPPPATRTPAPSSLQQSTGNDTTVAGQSSAPSTHSPRLFMAICLAGLVPLILTASL
ncbi:uncharacterized protein LOC135820093 [Sycon ciliatum]|uniref:uncharacterized protein LOC135820093 n=1 Tax=Sycon ciliatum TaxID=27933 RepID=UPI0031F66AFD